MPPDFLFLALILFLKELTWMHKDGVHPSPIGNKIIATLIAEKVRPLIPETTPGK